MTDLKSAPFKPQLWTRTLNDPALGAVRQFIAHTAANDWLGWEVYDGGTVGDRVKVEPDFIPLGYREVSGANGDADLWRAAMEVLQ